MKKIILTMASVAIILVSGLALAGEYTKPFVLRKALGCGTTCEAIFVSQGSGKVYKIEYLCKLETAEGTEVLIEFDEYNDYFKTIVNPRNGNRCTVSKVNKVE